MRGEAMNCRTISLRILVMSWIVACSSDTMGSMQLGASETQRDIWFSDDFENGSTASWELRPPSGPDGTFSVVSDGSQTLKYNAMMTGGVLATVSDQAWAKVPAGDYYVEARIKPLMNSNTGNKQLYLLARYQDDANWYGAGLNVQSSTSSTQVEIAKMAKGSLARPGQVKTPISLDTWYTVRFELNGSTLSVFLDGILLKSVTDAEWATGKIGLYTANKSFEIDDVRVGDPRDRPVQLAIDANQWTVEAKSAPKQIHVTAQKPSREDGSYSDDTFSVTSSAPSIAATTTEQNIVTVTPLAPGEAKITFTSGSDPTLQRVLSVTVEPEFVQPTAAYVLAGKTTPEPLAKDVYADSKLAIIFDAAPTLGTTGSVRIFRTRDDAQIDVIRLQNESDMIGYAGSDGAQPRRYVSSDRRIQIEGNSVIITPHNAVLGFGEQYYVAIADGLITGQLSGAPFQGLGKAAGWSFSTRAEPDPTKTTLSVDDDGASADFRSVQGALNFVMKNALADGAITINIQNGSYRELLFLRGHNNVSLVGESRDGVVIEYTNYESLNGGSGASQAAASGTPGGGRSVFLVENCDLLTLDSLTLKNSTVRSSSQSSQAETLYFNADAGRLIAKNASFISEQDTLQLKGYAWFYKSLIAGNVDFIWGANHVALFEESEIRSLGDSAGPDRGGYVVQARTVAQTDKGFVFLHSNFTHGPGPSGSDVPAAATYFARSSGNATAWDNVAIIECEIGDHIAPVGWAYDLAGQPKSNPPIATATSGWRESASSGAGGDMSQRKNAYALSPEEVATSFGTRAQIFSAYANNTGWTPEP
jgi:pectin methylesterase-like acyl-CoA thioesterase